MEEELSQQQTGLILGKFLPPHLGHCYLVDFARHYVDRLTVIVGTLRDEPIDGRLRYRWMKELVGDASVLHLTDENPQEPHQHPEFWKIWHDSIRRLMPRGPDYLFASDPYGIELAAVLGARFVPVDLSRSVVPISGSEVRQDPLRHWEFLPPVVRPYFVRRICIMGPESTGKSVLAQRLAEHYRTVCVPEYARPLLELQDNRCTPEDIPRIARGQLASEEALARQANRLMICDSDLVTTTLWSEVLFGSCPDWIRREADRQTYHLTLLADIDVPWIEDPQRYLPHGRVEFFERCRYELQSRKRPYVVIGGTYDERFRAACKAIDAVLEGDRPPGRNEV